MQKRTVTGCVKLALAMAFAAFTLFADYEFVDITVPADETVVIDTMTACKSLSVSGTLILKNRLILDSAYNGNYVLAPNASDHASIELQEIGAICATNNNGAGVSFDSMMHAVKLNLGSGHGKITVDAMTAGTTSGLCQLVIPEDAAAPENGETIDIVEYKSGFNTFSALENNSAYPARVVVANNDVKFRIAAWGSVLFKGTGKSIFENTAGGPIVFRNLPWYPFQLSSAAKNLTLKSDLVFDHHDGVQLYNTANLRLELAQPIDWQNGANLITSNMIIKALNENVLPYGENCGNVYSWSWGWTYDQGIAKNLMPYTGAIVVNANQCVNGIIGLGDLGGYVYNESASAERTLTFGTSDIAGRLQNVKMSTGKDAWTSGPVNVKKTGVGELKIEKSTLGNNLTVYDGSVTVDGAGVSTVPGKIALQPGKSLAVKSGSTLNAAGLSVDYFNVPTNDCKNGDNDSCSYYWMEKKDISALIQDFGSGQAAASVEVEAGATLALAITEASSVENVALVAAGTVEKSGAGAYVFKGGSQSFSGDIKVKEGSLAFSGSGITNKYWRWTITKNASTSGPGTGPLPLQARLTLRDQAGNNLTSGMSINKDAQAATDLAAKRFMIDHVDQMTASKFNHMFGTNWYDTNGRITANDGATIDALVITFRLADDATPATQYAYSTVGNENWPGTWTMESSPDGVNWTAVDSREKVYEGARWGYETAWYAWWTDKRWGNFKGLPFTFNLANEPASAASVDGAKVEVAAGATLDLTGTTGNIAAITIDCANGAGTIVGLNCAADGAIYLKNAAALSSGSSIMAVPSAGNADIRAWKVYCDGVEKKNYRAVIKNNAIAVFSSGMIVVVR
ncbi:MAG: hypothetical protein ACI4RD_06035 [Kiritimatiellia bacterium]